MLIHLIVVVKGVQLGDSLYNTTNRNKDLPITTGSYNKVYGAYRPNKPPYPKWNHGTHHKCNDSYKYSHSQYRIY